ncbi:unnamed protein product [Allacma fusca]|uniref:Uncharacterized protein n=1 Tax=Allacma fusca TaxID=39272 RepID=A0A8J2K275_9HEXA|nr:unnamed protein product [Allacma fusca]
MQLSKGIWFDYNSTSCRTLDRGTFLRIVKVGEDDIYYAEDYNHKNERYLTGCELNKFQRPLILVTDSFNATYVQANIL